MSHSGYTTLYIILPSIYYTINNPKCLTTPIICLVKTFSIHQTSKHNTYIIGYRKI